MEGINLTTAHILYKHTLNRQTSTESTLPPALQKGHSNPSYMYSSDPPAHEQFNPHTTVNSQLLAVLVDVKQAQNVRVMYQLHNGNLPFNL